MSYVLNWLRSNRLLTALALLAVAGHLVVRGVYEPENVDDPWTLSFLYNWLTYGTVVDVTFGNATSGSGGQNGLEHFGKLQALLYGPVLEVTNWSRNVAHNISSLLIFLTIPMWWQIIRRISSNTVPAAVFALCLFVSEPIVTASNETRPDALAFFLVSGAVFATSRGSYFVAGLLSLLAFEVHPMGAISVLYSLAIYLSRTAQLNQAGTHVKALIQFSAGASIGIAVYVALHWDALGTFFGTVVSSNGSGFGKSLTMYAFNSNYFRHVPEAVVFTCALGVFFLSGLWRKDRATLFLLAASLISLLLFRYGNHHYMLYYAPIALLVGFTVLSKFKHWQVPVVLFFGLMISQYGILSWRNGGFDIDNYVEQMHQQVPSDEVPVVSEFNGWFAFYDREFYGAYFSNDSFYFSRKEFSELALTEFYLVDRLISPQGASVGWRDEVLPRGMTCAPRGFFALQGQNYGTFYCAARATPAP